LADAAIHLVETVLFTPPSNFEEHGIPCYLSQNIINSGVGQLCKFNGMDEGTSLLACTMAAFIHLSFSSATMDYMDDSTDFDDANNEHLVQFQHGIFGDIQGQ